MKSLFVLFVSMLLMLTPLSVYTRILDIGGGSYSRRPECANNYVNSAESHVLLCNNHCENYVDGIATDWTRCKKN
jgi:hypothetical protein